MSYEYSENKLVQDSAGNLLRDELGWDVYYAYNTEKLGINGTFGRKNYREIVLWRYFKDAVFKLNPWMTETVYEVNETVSLNSRSEFLLLTDPNNTETELRTFPDSILLKTPGLYKVSQTPLSGEEVSEYFFVKLPAAESNINTSEDTLSNPFFVEREEIENQDLLLYFALALVALLLAEWWLQSREQF